RQSYCLLLRPVRALTPLAQDSAPGQGLWSPGPLALWSAALSARSGEDRFGDRRTVLVHAGLIMASIGIAGTIPADGTITDAGLARSITDPVFAGWPPRRTTPVAVWQSTRSGRLREAG